MSARLPSRSDVRSETRSANDRQPGRADLAAGAAVEAAGQTAAATRQPGGRLTSGVKRWLARRLLQGVGDPPIRIVLGSGEQIVASQAPPIASILIRDGRTLLRLLVDAELYFGEAYSDGRLEVEGDLLELLQTVFRTMSHAKKRPDNNSPVPAPKRQRNREARPGKSASCPSAGTEKPPGLLRGMLKRWLHRTARNTKAGSRANIQHHYDIGDDFYKLWLDEEMAYTCAYFPSPQVGLEEAQRAKMDYVSRKLWLKPGETVVEAGSGWGSLGLFMAREYGVKVKAFNISHAQTLYARRRAKAEGLDSRVEFIEDDYRNISGRFDVFVSVGMLEHVGADHYRELGRVIDNCLDPAGRGLIHSIGRDRPGEMDPWIERNIFPGAYPPSLCEMIDVLEPWGFSVLDVENLRLHYAQTLRHWRERYMAAEKAVEKMYDQRFLRTWRLYLTGSIAGFTTGSLQLFQILFARGGLNDIPWTRARLYRGSLAVVG